MINHSIIRADIDGFNTEIVVYNSGKSSILVGLHGFAGNAYTFRRIVRYLPEHITFYSLSLPWHGETTCNDDTKLLNLETYSDALAQWIDSLHIPDVNFVAHSFGARICSVLAIRHPRLVKQMFYLAPGGFYFPEDFMFRFMTIQPFRYLTTFDFAIRPYARFMIPRMKPEQEEAILYSLRKIGYSFPEISLRKKGLLKELIKYEGKLWLIMGKKDHLLPHSFGKKILSYWKKAELITFEKSGHLPMADNHKKTGEFITSKLTD